VFHHPVPSARPDRRAFLWLIHAEPLLDPGGGYALLVHPEVDGRNLAFPGGLEGAASAKTENLAGFRPQAQDYVFVQEFADIDFFVIHAESSRYRADILCGLKAYFQGDSCLSNIVAISIVLCYGQALGDGHVREKSWKRKEYVPFCSGCQNGCGGSLVQRP